MKGDLQSSINFVFYFYSCFNETDSYNIVLNVLGCFKKLEK
jgi:hypothetical protein